MSRCWNEGEWRAWLDGELEPVEMDAAREHLATCAACALLLDQVEARAHRVSARMALLDRLPEKPAAPRRAVTGGRPAAIVALALAAALALAFVLQPRRTPGARTVPPPAPTQSAMVVESPVPIPVVPAPLRRAPPKSHVDYYLGLDSEPIETGVVVRVALEDGLLADVIVDEQGRPRAVRPIHYEESQR